METPRRPSADLFEPGTASPRKPRRWWPIALAAGVPLVIVAVVYVIACWRAHAILRQAMDEIAARGEPLRFADLAARGDDKAQLRGRTLEALLNNLDGAPSDLLDQAAIQPLSDATAVTAQHAVDVYQAEIQAIMEVLRQGECEFNYDYSTGNPYNILLPHVQNVRSAQRLLGAEVHLALAQGDRQQTTRCLLELLELDRILSRDPFAVSQMTRTAVDGRCLDVLQAVVGHEAASDEDLLSIDDRLGTMESNFRLADCMRAERALILAMMENVGRPEMATGLVDNEHSVFAAKAAMLNYWWGSSLYRPRRLYQQAVMLRTMSQQVDVIDQPGPAASIQFEAAFAIQQDDDFPVLQAFSAFTKPLREMGLKHRQRLISARLALSVCRHRKRHGRLPESLEDLESPPIEKPIGLLSGKRLAYQVTSDGFAIYDALPDQGRFEVKFVNANRSH